MEHYVEGLPAEYRASVRQHITLADAMDEAIHIEVDMETPGHYVAKNGEKRKCEGSSESSRTKKGHQDKKANRSSFCIRCHSSHKGSCSDSTISCRRGKLGHK